MMAIVNEDAFGDVLALRIENQNLKDYIHRVGRTTRAGRSGVAISIVNQYELKWYIQIEKLIGKKLPEYPAQEEEVLLLLKRVTEAKRISQMIRYQDGDFRGMQKQCRSEKKSCKAMLKHGMKAILGVSRGIVETSTINGKNKSIFGC